MRVILITLLQGYRRFVSPLLGSNCRYHPSCACYAETAIEHFGVVRGVWMTLKRLLRCHPFHSGGFDPVPKKTMD